MLTNDTVKEFKEIYLKIYGKELSESEATEQAHQLIRLYKLVYTSFVNDDKKAIEEQRIECHELKDISGK